MTDSDKDRFLVALAGLKEVLGGQPLTPVGQRGYWLALRLSLIHI